jgi:hypothetical protein
MTSKDNTQQMPNSNGQVIAAIRSLEDRVANVEQIIVARLNTTRPLDQEVLSRLDNLVAGQTAMQEQMAALRADFEAFREETNHNFRLVNQKLGHLNNDFLHIRAENTLLENRVSNLEEQAA